MEIEKGGYNGSTALCNWTMDADNGRGHNAKLYERKVVDDNVGMLDEELSQMPPRDGWTKQWDCKYNLREGATFVRWIEGVDPDPSTWDNDLDNDLSDCDGAPTVPQGGVGGGVVGGGGDGVGEDPLSQCFKDTTASTLVMAECAPDGSDEMALLLDEFQVLK